MKKYVSSIVKRFMFIVKLVSLSLRWSLCILTMLIAKMPFLVSFHYESFNFEFANIDINCFSANKQKDNSFFVGILLFIFFSVFSFSTVIDSKAQIKVWIIAFISWFLVKTDLRNHWKLPSLGALVFEALCQWLIYPPKV